MNQESTKPILFTRGNPAEEALPIADLINCANLAFQREGKILFQYGHYSGYGPLREWIAQRFGVKYEQVLIGNSSMEFFTFVAALMVRPGDTVYVECPSYDRAITAMKRIGSNVVGIPLEKDGVNIEGLKKELKRSVPKIFYIIPHFQNPSGVSTSLEKRREITHLAQEVMLMKNRRMKMKALLQEQLEVSLPDGFTVRGAVVDDVDTALQLFNRWSQSVLHEDEITDAVAIRTEWVSPGFDPAEDIRLVFAPDGEMVGYVEVWTTVKPPVHPWIWARVDPRYEGIGIGCYLLTWGEKRASRVLSELPADLRFALRMGTYQKAERAKRLFLRMGYQRIRSSYNMRINMNAPPAEPQWAGGITLRTCNPETDLQAVYHTVDEAFRDHFGHLEIPFEEGFMRFKHMMTRQLITL